MDLVGKTGIVTGAARGIGRGIALGLAKEGINMLAVDLIKAQLDDLVREIKGLDREVLAVEGDVTSAESMEGMVQEAIKAFGQIHILVNNAGVVVVALNVDGGHTMVQPISFLRGSGVSVSLSQNFTLNF